MTDASGIPDGMLSEAPTDRELVCDEVYTIKNKKHETFLRAYEDSSEGEGVVRVGHIENLDRSGASYYSCAWKCVDLGPRTQDQYHYCKLVNVLTGTPLALKWGADMTRPSFDHTGPEPRSETWRLGSENTALTGTQAWRISNVLEDESLEVSLSSHEIKSEHAEESTRPTLTSSSHRQDDTQLWSLRRVSVVAQAAAKVQAMLEVDFTIGHSIGLSSSAVGSTRFIATPSDVARTAFNKAQTKTKVPEELAGQFLEEVQHAVGDILDLTKQRPLVGVLCPMTIGGVWPLVYFVFGTNGKMWYVTANGNWMPTLPPGHYRSTRYIAIY